MSHIHIRGKIENKPCSCVWSKVILRDAMYFRCNLLSCIYRKTSALSCLLLAHSWMSCLASSLCIALQRCCVVTLCVLQWVYHWHVIMSQEHTCTIIIYSQWLHTFIRIREYSVKGRELAILIPSNLQILFSNIVHFMAFMVYVSFMQCYVMRERTRCPEEWPCQGIFKVSQGVI